MKKIILTLAAIALSMTMSFAQDVAKATETYNSAAEAYSTGDKASALKLFKNAMDAAKQCGDAGKDIVANCQEYIPQLTLSLAKDLFKEKKYDEAITALQESVKVADEFENGEVSAEATDLLSKAFTLKAKTQLAAKDIAGAVATCNAAIESDPENGSAYLYLGQALAAGGKTDEAIEAFKKAGEKGQEVTAKKQISTIYLKKASAALKAKDYAAAIEAAVKSNEFNESATSYKIAGTASMNLQKNAEAVTYLTKYLELSPKASDKDQISAAIEALKKVQ